MLSDLYYLLKNTVAYAFSDRDVVKLKQLEPEILKPAEVLPPISTESPLLSEVFHFTLNIFPSLCSGKYSGFNGSIFLQTMDV